MNSNDRPPHLVLQELIQGALVPQCIHVAAKLGIPDLLKAGPRSSEDLAAITGTHAPSLYRVLRLLTAVGLFTEEGTRSFALAPLGALLQTGVPGSLRSLALLYGEKSIWLVMGDLLHSVQTGEPAFEHVFGQKIFEYLAQQRAAAEVFNDVMTDFTASVAPTVADGYDFSSIDTLVDVGGGHGQMLASILQAHPTLRGVLFDLPHVVEGAPRLLEAAGVSDRCRVLGGDAFTAVPAGHHAYLLSRVIHDWDDGRAVALLSRCHDAMTPPGRLLLVERVIPSDRPPELHVLQSDVMMLAVAGGMERTEDEYRALLATAGFQLRTIAPALPPFFVLEAVPA